MGVGTAGVIILILIFSVIIVISSWIIFVHLRARRLGLPQPTLSSYNPFAHSSSSYGVRPAPGGIVGWVNDKIRTFKNRNNRVAGGAYEEPLSSNVRGRAANRGFGPLDPDEAWDARVGTEADAYGPGGYYEEQELGLTHNEDTSYAQERGRARSREPGLPEPYIGGSKGGLDRRYDEEMGMGGTGAAAKRPMQNPFDDDAAEPSAVSLRGVSPRPMDAAGGTGKGHAKKDSTGDSPTERRSMFQENM
jgi:hypothetical protein